MSIGLGVLVILLLVALYDVIQTKHSILRNFPIIGHFRYLLEMVGPELRQYIVTNNDEERPFSRDQRTWVYASSKKQNNYFGFGTDNDLERSPNYLIVKQSTFPLPELRKGDPGYSENHVVPCAKVLGEARGRRHAFRPDSVINISGMSFGSLSGPAVEAINRGCANGCIQAQRCHTGHCPTGIATQNRWLMRGLDPTDKAVRLANYVVTLRKELLQLAHICELPHPGLITADQCEILDEKFGSQSARRVFELSADPAWGVPSAAQAARITELMNASEPVKI